MKIKCFNINSFCLNYTKYKCFNRINECKKHYTSLTDVIEHSFLIGQKSNLLLMNLTEMYKRSYCECIRSTN